MEEMRITEVQIIPVKPSGGLVAFASCVINGTLYAGNIAIHTSLSAPDGLRLVYPDKILPNGKVINCFHPITKEAGEVIKKAIVSKYLDICDRRGDPGSR
jgi:DNA-binding cell septation regulator SpoVG